MAGEKILAAFALASALLIVAADARAADATVTAVGQFAFTVPGTATVTGLRRAHIEMCDEDGFGVCSVFASGETAEDGRFILTGISGDWFGDLPEAEVRVYATSPGVEVSSGSAVYCFKTVRRDNVPNGRTVDFGTITPEKGYKCTFGESAAGENGAWATFQWAQEAFEFLRGTAAPGVFSGLAGIPGQGVSQQKVKWPTSEEGISPDFTGFSVRGGDERWYGNVTLPYAIVAITRRLGAWTPTYNDWDGYFAMTLSAIIGDQFHHPTGRLCSAADPTFCGTLESPPHTSCDIAGMLPGVGSIGTYWDLYDPASAENHDSNATSDALQLPLDLIWSVVRDYDPAPADPNNNHADNVQEFGRGLLARVASTIQPRIRDIYDENHIVQP